MKPIYESEEPSQDAASEKVSAADDDKQDVTTSRSRSWSSTLWIVILMVGIAIAGFGSSAGWFSKKESQPDGTAVAENALAADMESETSSTMAGAINVEASQPSAEPPPVPLNPLLPEDSQAVLAECKQVLTHLQQLYPNSIEAKELEARYEFDFGDTQRASQLWSEILEVKPNFVYALRGLGDVATIDGDLDGAVRFFRRAVLADPDALTRQVTLGIALLHAARLQEAKDVLTAVLAKDPNHLGAHVELASVLLEMEEFDEARKHFETALEVMPDKAELHFGLATAYRRLDEIEKAKYHFSEHRRLQQDVQSEREQGRRDYDDLEAMNIDIARLYVDAARVHLAASNRPAAERLLIRSNRMDPQNLDAVQALAFLAGQDGELFEAIKWMKQVAALQPDVYAYAGEVANLYLQAGQPRKAEETLLEFIGDHAQDLAAIKSAAVFFLQALSDYPQAIELGKQAVELAATAENYAMLATIYDAAGENEKAIEALQRAVQMDPANASYQQALALMRENDTLEKIDN